jgi:hypothetical protein
MLHQKMADLRKETGNKLKRIQNILIKLKKNLPTTRYPLLAVITLVMITACGYKPSSQLIKKTFHDKIYVQVVVDRVEPENAPFVKDEMNRLVYTRFKGRVASREEAGSSIRISYSGSTFSPLTYKDGYVSRYRVNVRVHFDMMTKQGRISKTISSIFESTIQNASIDTSAVKTEAIRLGLEKALDEFMAYAAAKSANLE